MIGLGVLSTLASMLVLAVIAELVTRYAPKRPGLAQLLWLSVLLRGLIPSIPLITTGLGAPTGGGLPVNLGASSIASKTLTGLGWGDFDLASALIAIWIAVAAAMLVRSCVRNWKVRSCLRFGGRVDEEFEAEIASEAARIGISKPEVVSLAGIRSPFICGTSAPILVWPASNDAPFTDARSTVLLHELAHLKRKDQWTAWIELIASCVWWWNPIVWYSVSQSRRTKELACDAHVVAERPNGRKAYATALIEAIRLDSSQAVSGQFLGWIGSSDRVKERLRSIYSVRASERLTATNCVSLFALLVISLPGLAGDQNAQGNSVVDAASPSAVRFLERYGVDNFEQLRDECLVRIESDATDGAAYYRLGIAQSFLGDLEAACVSFKRQFEISYSPTYASYNLACCYSKLGELDQALYWLEESAHAADVDPIQFEEDDDLANLREDPRYGVLLTKLLARSRD